jgi:hypothetical protein
MRFGRSRNGNNPRFLRKQPSQGNLRARHTLLVCYLAENIDQFLVGLSRFRAEAREDATDILFGELRVFVDCTREKTFAQRAEGNETDIQLLERRQNLFLRFAPPE